MAKLVQCKDCGNQISKNADSCPNCGAKVKRTSVLTWIAIIFIGMIVISAMSSIMSDEDVISPDANISSAEEPVVTAGADETSLPVTSEPEVQETASNWEYEESTDEMRGSASYFATIGSVNNIRLEFPYTGGTSLFLIIRNMPENGNEVLISTDNGQLWCEYSNCYMSAKFDDGEVKRYPLARAAAGSSETMFLDGSIEQFINDLKQSKTAMIEIGFFNYGNQQFRFDTNGLEWSH